MLQLKNNKYYIRQLYKIHNHLFKVMSRAEIQNKGAPKSRFKNQGLSKSDMERPRTAQEKLNYF